jgi:cytochrome c
MGVHGHVVLAADPRARSARARARRRGLIDLSPAALWRGDDASGNIAGVFPLIVLAPEITMKRYGMLLAAALFVAGGANAALDNKAAEELMKKDGCAACHAIDKKVIGPAYQEVAAKYKGDASAAAKLADKVKKGGVGVWGQVPMPPNAQIPDADIKNLVAWILSLKK